MKDEWEQNREASNQAMISVTSEQGGGRGKQESRDYRTQSSRGQQDKGRTDMREEGWRIWDDSVTANLIRCRSAQGEMSLGMSVSTVTDWSKC